MCETAGFLGHFGIACGGWSITGVNNRNGVARMSGLKEYKRVGGYSRTGTVGWQGVAGFGLRGFFAGHCAYKVDAA